MQRRRSRNHALWVILLALLPAASASAQEPAQVEGVPSARPRVSEDGVQDFTANPRLGERTEPLNLLQRTGNGRDLRQSGAVQPAPIVPTEFQRVVAQSTGEMPAVFGVDLFRVPPSTFAPVDNIPVTPDYTIGPGDELRVQVWGEIDQRGTYTVDRSGAIEMPEVGTLHVAGLRFSQVTPFLKSQLGRVYRNFDLNVNLGQLRSIQVFVTGKARQPGSYTIGSMSTLLNALFAAGGPMPDGSLRDIQVKRDGQTVTHFDLYDMILRGDKTKDVRLEPGDLIFIPNAGAQVAVVGSVRTPAVYELRDEKSVAQVIALAGGESSTASAEPIRVERVAHHLERSGIEVDLARDGSAPVQDGDILLVRSVVPRFDATVTLRGNVTRPGRRAWHEGMRVSDLIPDSRAVVTQEYYTHRNELGLNAEDRASDGTGLVTNQPTNKRTEGALDETRLGEREDPSGSATAGEALTGGSQRFKEKTQVVLSAPDVDWNYAVIERQNEKTLATTLIPFNLGDVVLRHEAAKDLTLLPGDVVTVFSKADIRVPSVQQTKFVKLEGEFTNAGYYSVLPGETLRQLLERAGGFTPDADLFASEFTRESVRRLQQERLREYANMLQTESLQRVQAQRSSAIAARDSEAAQASEAAAQAVVTELRQMQASGRIVMRLAPESKGIEAIPDMTLEDGDRFLVPKAPSFVSVAGNVYHPSALGFDPKGRVKDYLEQAGSPNRLADKRREFILRANGAVISRMDAHGRRGRFDELPVYPGDTIIVPPKYVRGSLMRDLLNASTIFEGFGLGAAAFNLIQ